MDMLDRMQTGRFKVFRVDRSQGYTCDPKQSLPGADRALTDIAAAVEVLRRRPDVARQPILMAGISRGGILSIAYAGMHPGEVAGVINFVGGWMGEGCPNASEINGTLFKRGGMFPHPTLWLYGNHDPFYSLDHSRANFAAFQGGGRQGVVLRLRGARRERAHGDVLPAALDRPRRSLSRLDRRGGETVAVRQNFIGKFAHPAEGFFCEIPIGGKAIR